jgi:hypothetical protein
MHEHDLDLIAEYAGGSLSDASEAARLVSSCERCATEFTAHRAVLEALGSLPPVTLGELERARLHRDVLAAIEADSPSPVRVIRPASTSRWWERVGLRVAAVAAVALVGVGLVGVLARMSPTADMADTIAAEMAPDTGDEAETTTAAAEMAGLAAADTSESRLENRIPTIVDLGNVDRAELTKAIEEQQAIVVEQARSTEAGAPTLEAPKDGAVDEFADRLGTCAVDPGAALVIVAEVEGRPIAIAFDERGEPSAVWTDSCEAADIG